MKTFSFESSSENLRAIAEEIEREDRAKMPMGYLERDEEENQAKTQQGTTTQRGDAVTGAERAPTVQRLQMEIEEGIKRNGDRRRALRILQAHPEFEDFLWLARSGLVPILFLILATAIGRAQTATPPLGTDHHINSTWVAPTNPGPPCNPIGGTALTKGCQTGYTMTITPPAGVPGGANVIPSCSATVTTGCIGIQTAYSWGPVPGPLYCGQWGITLTASYLDDNGTAAQSTAIASTVTEPCPFVAIPPSNLNSTVGP